MRLKPPPSRKLPLSLTPLIDVVFLLLIFFMLASTFLKFSALPISGSAGGAGPAKIDTIALLQLSAGGSLTLNGSPVTTGTLAGRIDDLVSAGVRRAVVRTRPGATVQDVVRVLEITRRTRLENVVVVK
jgi:biopolymer transport protein ExbD